MQYEVHEEEMDKIINDAEDKPLLQMKLKDVSVLYQAFREYLSDHFMTSEEVLEVLAKEIPFSRKLRGSTVILDGYTGFTPVQHTVTGNSGCLQKSFRDGYDGCQRRIFGKGKAT